MKQTKVIALSLLTIAASVGGYTVALFTPGTISRTRASAIAAFDEWVVRDNEDAIVTAEHVEPFHTSFEGEGIDRPAEESLRLRIIQLERELDQTLVDLGDSIKLVDSLREQLHLAEERHEVAKQVAAAVIQQHLSQPMLMLAPTPEEPESESENQIIP